MIIVRARCESLSPLLMNPMTEAIIDSLVPGQNRPKTPDKTPLEECGEKLYKEGDKIGIPSLNLFSCMVGAGKWIKVNVGGARPQQISTGDTTLLPALVAIQEFFLPFEDGVAWVVDKRAGKNDTGKAVRIIRPKFDTWSFTVTLEIDETQLNERLARQLLTFAGSRVGLGDFRPACKGPFGRFKVVNWEVVEKIETEPAKESASGEDGGK